MRMKTLGGAAVGVVIGGILFNAPDAHAIFGVGDVVTDPGLYTTMAAVQSAITGAIQSMENAVVNKFTDIGNLIGNQLTAGFTQQSNYAKAAVGAQEQIADASNTAMATYQKDLRNARLRDEHTMSPQACTALNMGQAITVSAGQSWRVGQALSAVTDPRGEAGPGTPANAGQGQAAAAITQLHSVTLLFAERGGGGPLHGQRGSGEPRPEGIEPVRRAELCWTGRRGCRQRLRHQPDSTRSAGGRAW